MEVAEDWSPIEFRLMFRNSISIVRVLGVRITRLHSRSLADKFLLVDLTDSIVFMLEGFEYVQSVDG
jgi:hypothetical protein